MLTAHHHIQVVRTADKGDAPAARIDEVLGGLLGSDVAIGGDTREFVRQTGAPEEHHGYLHVVDLLEVTVVAGILRQTGNDALDMQVDEVIDGFHLELAILVSVGTDDRVTGLAGLVLDTIEHSRIVVRNQVRHYHADNPGRLFT